MTGEYFFLFKMYGIANAPAFKFSLLQIGPSQDYGLHDQESTSRPNIFLIRSDPLLSCFPGLGPFPGPGSL
jgi:hypothetical protein